MKLNDLYIEFFFFFLFRASGVLCSSTDMFVFGWSMVSYLHSNTLQLCAPVFHSCGTSP